jgi:DNA-directed RNA polymerase subunit RPC12/RpoP
MPAKHGFLKFILPAGAFEAVKAGTKQWLAECPCGHKRDVWDSGGVRYLAAGEPRRLARCPKCGKFTLCKIRRKTEVERRELP